MDRRSFVRFGVQIAGGMAVIPLLPGCGGGDDETANIGSDGRATAEGDLAPGSYSAASGSPIYGGITASPILALVQAAPENSWVRVNLNGVSTTWPDPDYVPVYAGGNPGTTTAVIRCWSSFAWDPKRSRMILYGGGHANYDGNEVYVFEGNTRQWKLGFWPTDAVIYNAATAEKLTVDGPLNSPISAHTYDNSAYLEILDRYITFGGAGAHLGGPYAIHNDGPSRAAGPYTLDLTLAGQGMVGGLPGSNVKRGSSAGASLAGARAWAVRDYYKDHAAPNGALQYMTSHISCGTAYTQENGHDVIYMTARPGYHLLRIEFVDHDYRNDLISRVGVANNSPPDWDATVAFDPVKKVVLILGKSPSLFWGWDLSPGPVRSNFLVSSAGLTGPGANSWRTAFVQTHGIDFAPLNNQFVMWSEGGQVHGMLHGGGLLSANWVVDELRTNTGVAGVDRPKTRAELDAEPAGVYAKADNAVNGKWKWAPDINAFVALQHSYAGNVWIYKPKNWLAPTWL